MVPCLPVFGEEGHTCQQNRSDVRRTAAAGHERSSSAVTPRKSRFRGSLSLLPLLKFPLPASGVVLWHPEVNHASPAPTQEDGRRCEGGCFGKKPKRTSLGRPAGRSPVICITRYFSWRQTHTSPCLSGGGIQPTGAQPPGPRQGRRHDEAI